MTSFCFDDPWFFPKGACHATWFPYPHHDEPILPQFYCLSAPYLSHEHLDHFDPWFLAQADKSTSGLAGPFVKGRIARKLGFEIVIEFDEFEVYELSREFVIRITVPSFNGSSHWFELCALIQMGRRWIERWWIGVKSLFCHLYFQVSNPPTIYSSSPPLFDNLSP